MGVAKDEVFNAREVFKPDLWEVQVKNLKQVILPKGRKISKREVIGFYGAEDEGDIYVAFSSKVRTNETVK